MGRYLRIYRDFSGGLSEAANDNIADNQMVEARNIMPGDGFGIARTFGTSIAYPQIPVSQPTLNKVTRLIELKPVGKDTQILAFIDKPAGYEDMYFYDEANNIWLLVEQNVVAIKDWFIQAGKLYWLNGASIKVYDGSNVGTVTLTPLGASATAAETVIWAKVKTAVAVEQRGQRWFYGTADNEIIFSEVGEPTQFTPTNIINVNTKNGDSITALHEFNDGLLIFKKRSIHYLVGWDFADGTDVQLIHLNVSSGTAFPKSIITVENGILYLGINGVYRLSLPSYSTVIASENISEGKISGRLFDSGIITEAHAAAWDNSYYLSVRKTVSTSEDGVETGTEIVNYEYRYQVKSKAFFGEFTQGITTYAVGLAGERALFLGCDNGYVLRYDKESNNYIDTMTGEQTAINSVARTKCYDVAGSMVQEVRLERLEVASRQFMGETCRFNMQVKADYGELSWDTELVWDTDTDDSLVYGEGLLGVGIWGWQDTVTKEMVVRRRCKRLQFIIKTVENEQPLLIYGLAILYRKKRIKGSRRGVAAAAVSD